MERKVFAEKINRLCVAFGMSAFSDDRGELYYEFLGGCDGDVFSKAIESVIISENWFPSIAVLKNHIEKSGPDATPEWY